MERKRSGSFFGSSITMRLLSLALALVLLLGMLPNIQLEARAAQTVTVYFKNSDNWGSVYGYVWDGSETQLVGTWPGKKLSLDSATGLYTLTLEYVPTVTGSFNFIFNNNAGSQTADLSLTYSQLTSGKSYWVNGMEGTPCVYALPTVEDGKVTFTYEGSASEVLLAGTMNNWSGVAMTKSGSTFTYTYELSAGMYEYKFVVDGTWTSDPRNPQTTGSDNNSYIVVSGSSDTATTNSVKLHFRNTLGWGTVCGSAWAITGTTSEAIDGWSWPGQALQKDSDGNYLMELQPNLVAGQTLGYLFHDFDSQQTVDLTLDYATLSKGNVELWITPGTADDNGKFTCSTATSYTAYPKVEGNQVTFSYTGSATSVYVAGDFNSWSSSAAKMTKSGSTFTYSTTLEDGIYQYKFVVNGSDWIADPLNGTVAGSDGNSILYVGDTTANTADDKITVQFHVTKTGGYTGWDSWVWSDNMDGTAYALKTGTLSDKLVSVTVDSSTSYVGFILRKSDWSTQDDTYYVDLKTVSSGTVHYFVDYAKDSGLQVNDKDVKVCGSLSYAKMDYESNTIWVKTTAPMDVSGILIADTAGNASGVTVTGVNADGFGYSLSLGSPVTLDDLSELRLRLNGAECKIEPNDYLFYSGRFASEYTYNGNDLGATWSKNSTTFKVWAPTAWKMQVVRYESGRYDGAWIETVDMTRGANGVWSVTVKGDLNGTYYNYIAHFANYTTEAVDPYAKSTGPNSDRGMVLDMSTTNPAGWTNDISPNQGMTYTDAIIYEMHVREFTLEESSGVKAEWRGKFLGLTQEGTTYEGRATGIDHLKELGITHVQLMPVYDFGYPDEYGTGGYSWGYNPRHFNVPEGTYATDAENGEVRVNEFKQMVQTFHSNGINVVMDVVYNHLDSAGDFCYNKLVPYYFTRFWDKNGDWGNVCNGSGVGNDFATQRSMARNYIVDSLSWWVEEYHVDGFRFDLAGLIDTQTINEAISIIQAKYPSVIFYGEGWDNYGTNMEGYDTTTQYNSWMVPGFGFFNNTLRDALGGNESKDNTEWGFAMGSSEKAETVMNSLRGINSWSSNPNQTINYVSCHDGYSLTDKICVKRNGAYWSEIAAMNRLAGATILLSQGIPMIYSGDEILREKLAPAGWRAHNSGHESGVDLDALNSIKWNELVDKDYAQTNDDYYAGLIEFRKNHSALRCSYIDNGTPDAQKYTSAHRVSDQCILLYVDGYPNYECSDGIVIILNAGSGTQWVNIYDYGVPSGDWQACIHGDKAGINALWTTSDGSVGVDGYSATVLVKGDLVDENSVYNRQASNTGCRHTDHDENGICTGCGASVSHSFVSGTCSVCGKTQPTGSQTIYVDITGSGWSKVNVYTWNGDGPCTGEWPGSAMTKVEGSVYSFEVPVYAENIIFNDGTTQTDDLTIPTDGKNLYSYATNSWGSYGSDCGHSYTSAVTTEATCTAAGVRTYTCGLCGASYTESIPATGHNFVNGTCTGCGASNTVSTTYYLVGYINGADHGCEDDYENMGNYKFVNGKLTATFDADSYVFLKTEGNGKWYLTESYCTDTIATFVIGGTEKMFVPGGVELNFTVTENADGSLTLSYSEAPSECDHTYDEGEITKDASCGVEGEVTYTCTKCGDSYTEPTMPWAHNYVDGTCTLCGAADPDYVKPVVTPTLALKYPTVSFEDVIVMNVYYAASDLDDVVDMGLITYSSEVDQWNIENAEAVISGYSYDEGKQMYMSSTNGIAAKNLGDTVYFAVYAELADGTYAYTKLVSYSPKTYAYAQLSSGSAEIKALVVAMLKYGAAAQTFFGHNTDALVDSDLTADQLALIEEYRADMMNAVASPDAAKQGAFAANGGITRKYPTVSFEGAFEINYYCVPANTPVDGVTMYYWNQADYDAAEVLTAENATAAIAMDGTGTYQTAIKGIAAKDLDKGIYVAFVYSDGTTTYSSGVLAYSIGTYCNASVNGDVGALAKATAVYGYCAKLAFYGEA